MNTWQWCRVPLLLVLTICVVGDLTPAQSAQTQDQQQAKDKKAVKSRPNHSSFSTSYIDLRHPSFTHILAVVYFLLIVFLLVRASSRFRRFLVCTVGFALVLLWWPSLKPTNNGQWQADVRLHG